MKNKIFSIIILILLLLVGRSSGESFSTLRTDSLVDDIAMEFENLLRQNQRNNATGQSSKNQYILFYSIGAKPPLNCDWGQTSCSCWLEHTITLHSSLTPDICQRYTDFNNNNPSKVQHYIIALDYPGVILKTDMIQNQEASPAPVDHFLNNLAGNNKAAYDLMISELKERIPNSFASFPDSDIDMPEKIVTVAGQFTIANNEDIKLFNYWKIRKGNPESLFLTNGMFSNFVQEIKKNQNGKFDIASRMQTTIDFFTDHIHPDTDCWNLKGGVTHPEAKAYLDLWCGFLINNYYPGINLDYIKEIIYPIAKYIDKYHFLSDHSLWDDIEPEDLFIDPVQYLALLQNDPNLDYFDNLKQELLSQCENPNASTGQGINYLMYHIDDLFFSNLSIQELICFTQLYINLYEGGFDAWLENDDYSFFIKVFRALAENEKFDKDSCQIFRTAFLNIPKSTRRLFLACDDATTPEEYERELTQLITRFSYKLRDMPSSEDLTVDFFGEEHLYIWNLPAFFVSTCGLYCSTNVYYYCISENQNNVGIRWHIYGCEGPQNDSYDYDCYGQICPNWDASYETVYSPFDIVGIMSRGDKVNILTDCSNLDCKLPLGAISAFQMAWLIEKKYDEQAFEKFVFTGELIGAFLGITQIVGAWRAGNLVKWVYVGMTTIDFAAGEMTSELVETYFANRGIQQFQQADRVLKVLALGSGISSGFNIAISIKDASRAYSTYNSLQKTGVEFVEDMGKFELRCEALTEITDNNVFLVKQALHEIGVNEDYVIRLMEISPIQLRSAVLGHVFTDPDVVDAVNANELVIDFLKGIHLSEDVELHKLLVKFTDDDFAKMSKDIRLGEMESAFSSNINLIKSWHGLSNAPDFVRRNIGIINTGNELLAAGFNSADLWKVSIISNEFLARSFSQSEIINMTKQTMESAKIAKQNFSNIGTDIDVINNLEIALNDILFINSNPEINGLITQIRNTINTNPGYIEQLNEGVRRIQLGKQVKVEGDLNGLGDVLDITQSEAIQMKTIIGTQNDIFKDKLFEAMGQFTSEPPPINYSKIPDIRIRASGVPEYNLNAIQLKSNLDGLYTNGSQTFRSRVESMSFFDIVNNAGRFRFKFENSQFVIVN